MRSITAGENILEVLNVGHWKLLYHWDVLNDLCLTNTNPLSTHHEGL